MYQKLSIDHGFHFSIFLSITYFITFCFRIHCTGICTNNHWQILYHHNRNLFGNRLTWVLNSHNICLHCKYMHISWWTEEILVTRTRPDIWNEAGICWPLLPVAFSVGFSLSVQMPYPWLLSLPLHLQEKNLKMLLII